MTPYIFVIILVIFPVIIEYLSYNFKYDQKCTWLLLLILVLFAGTRFETGNDWYEYTKVFSNIPSIDTFITNPVVFGMFRMEPGYILLNSIIKTLGGSIDAVFFVSVAFTIIVLFCVFKRYSFFCALAVMLYMRYGYLQTNMMFVRQGIAISILFFSYKYIILRRPVKFFLSVFIATMFHSSAILSVCFYFIIYREYSNFIIILSIIVSLCLSFIDISQALAKILPGFISNSILAYSESEMWGEMGGKFSFGLLEKIVIALLCIVYRKQLNKNHYFNIYFNLFVLSIICYFAFFQMYVFQQRLSMLLQIATIPVVISLVGLVHKEQRIYPVFILALLTTYFFINYIQNGEKVYIPYQSWLF